MYDNLKFFTMEQTASIFCNVSFAGQYIIFEIQRNILEIHTLFFDINI